MKRYKWLNEKEGIIVCEETVKVTKSERFSIPDLKEKIKFHEARIKELEEKIAAAKKALEIKE